MASSRDHSDFLLNDLWRWHSQLEICTYELQELLLSAEHHSDLCEDTVITGTCYLSSLEVSKKHVQREIVAAASFHCPDSPDEKCRETMAGTEGDQKLVTFLDCVQRLVSEAKTCINELRIYEESKVRGGYETQMQWKGGKWIKSFRGCDLETAKNSRNEFGRLKRNFEQQMSNIMVLEKERNRLAVEIERLKTRMEKCGCRQK